jgi:methyl-accepting chemotaxis protein
MMNIQMKLKNIIFSGFGVLLLLIFLMVLGVLYQNDHIKTINERIITKEWVKVKILNDISQATLRNGENTLKLLIIKDNGKLNKVREDMQKKKAFITEQLAFLDTMLYLPKSKSLFNNINETRNVYVTSFSKVSKLQNEGLLEEAVSIMENETMPLLDKLQDSIDTLLTFQSELVTASNLELEQSMKTLSYLLWGFLGIAIFFASSIALFISRFVLGKVGGEPNYVNEVTQKIARGNLNARIDIHPKDDSSILFAVREMRNNLRDIIGTIRTGSESIATGANQIARGNLDLSERTEDQASSLEETASAMEQLNGTVKQNAANADSAKEYVMVASEVALKGGAVVSKVVTTMRSINESSKKIVDIITVIDSIAFQTNILALNAAVEAARAGEQGRGFAVVASEVRNLAQRSAAAAKEIKQLIDASVEEVDIGTKLVNAAGDTMEEIVNSVKRVSDIMIEISSASHEQSQGIGQANQAITQMDGVTQQNAALVEEAAAAASSLLDEAQQLVNSIALFESDDKFAKPVNKVSLQHSSASKKNKPMLTTRK